MRAKHLTSILILSLALFSTCRAQPAAAAADVSGAREEVQQPTKGFNPLAGLEALNKLKQKRDGRMAGLNMMKEGAQAALSSGLLGTIGNGVQGLNQLENGAKDAIGNAAGAAVGATLPVAGAMVDKLYDIQNFQQGAVNAARGLPGRLFNTAQAAGNVVQGLGQVAGGVSNYIATGITTTTDAITDRVVEGFQTAANVVQVAGTAADTVSDIVATGIKEIPGNVKNNFNDAKTVVTQDLTTLGATLGQAGNLAQVGVSALPPMGQILQPSAWRDAYLASEDQLNNAYAVLEDNIEDIINGISAKFCREAAFTPKVKKPARFESADFALVFASGQCELNDDEFFDQEPEDRDFKDKKLTCFRPSVTFTTTPATISSKFKAGARFRNKECKIVREFGEVVERVLYVFDGSETPDVFNLTSRVATEMQQLLGGFTAGPKAISNQLQTFLSNAPSFGFGLGKGMMQGFGRGAAAGQPGGVEVSGARATPSYNALKQAVASYPAHPFSDA